MSLSTSAVAVIGALLLLFEVLYLLSASPAGNVDYGWAQAGAWLGGVLLAVATLKYLLWDRRRGH